jgi:integrase
MSVFQPTYRDKQTGEWKKSATWWYDFTFAGMRIKESANTTLKTIAREAEAKRGRELQLGINALPSTRRERIATIEQLAETFLEDYKVRQPKSAVFASYALAHVKRLLGASMTVDVTDKAVIKYQTTRLKEKAAPKTINEEVGLLLRLLPAMQAGALRAQLKQVRKLKLKVRTKVGKAYTEDEKTALRTAAGNAPRSKGILLATMLAQHAGMRDKEIRTLQWTGFNR